MGPSAWKGVAAGVLAGRLGRIAARPAVDLGRLLADAVEVEWEHRRFFLWLPACAGVGVLLYFAADREPVLWLPVLLACGAAALAGWLRHHRPALLSAMALAAVASGFVAAELRTASVGAPVLSRIRIVKLAGLVEEVDHRRVGSRFVLRLTRADDLAPADRPLRVRLTTRRDDPLNAGDQIAVTARLLPPSQAALPGGYAFARDAYFAGFGAVGSVLGRIRPEVGAAATPSWRDTALTAVDRARNALALRVDTVLGGDVGAIAAAMVTGKRDLLSDDGRTLIREAGIFHIITIAGVQMTLVAGLLYGTTRRLLALSPTLALTRPIKKWAALVGIAGAIAYDILTGSRIGTQRALVMTLIMLGAVLVDRRGFTMRNLALAALAVVLIEPESIMGASFQLSFAAVAALVAVYEARHRRRESLGPEQTERRGEARSPLGIWGWPWAALGHGRALLVATACATSATACFMAADFHEISPYVLVGNPLTLGIIEFFAVPGALIGCALYPLGLDGWVWSWVGLGIRIVLAVARLIAAAPASTITLPAFAPWALPMLTLAVLSAVIWRSTVFRLTAVPLALAGLLGATLGPRYDMIVAPGGDAVAVRAADGHLALTGKLNAFAAEQWLRADGDGRTTATLHGRLAEAGRCDPLACVVPLPGAQTLSLIDDPAAFEEDCRRADAIVTPLLAPASCAAPLILDRASLAMTGALGLTLRNGGWVSDPVRGPMEDRPWSRPPPRAIPRPNAQDDSDATPIPPSPAAPDETPP